ncbi:MAG: methyltransferase domain-containing protein [Pyrinomonadaceae bacterium]|nr:methyltransferase domain-containing protein [Pyrinomonadaceae bacterium]MCX7640918.1 methyltransferase domain-containing protein [Pyrinomonadaceae bacterium]MDW8304700.1 methyltransferase domain-containing protein [Acidobacteriota bacterium]
MKDKLLDFLACPVCGGEILMPYVSRYEGLEIIDAILSCKKCLREYKVKAGIPRFADVPKNEDKKLLTARNFGWQWAHFTQTDEKYESQLLDWLQPVKPDFFEEKIVLEGGCGKGRHTTLAAKWGAREVIGIDLSESVEIAFERTKNLPNVHIVQADIFRLPFKRVFDYTFSVGVIHHTPNPKKAFLSIASKVKAGGAISVWVYGAENNEWIVKYVSPIRESLTSRISPSLLFHFSKIPTLAVFLASKFVYRPLSKVFHNRKFFYQDYMLYLSEFGWREQHNIVFDHLTAPVTFYITRSEFEKWWEEANAREVKITWCHENSWSGFGIL